MQVVHIHVHLFWLLPTYLSSECGVQLYDDNLIEYCEINYARKFRVYFYWTKLLTIYGDVVNLYVQ